MIAIKSIPHRHIGNEDDDHEQHVVLKVSNTVATDYKVMATKIATIVSEITRKILIVQRILNLWARLKCTRFCDVQFSCLVFYVYL